MFNLKAYESMFLEEQKYKLYFKRKKSHVDYRVRKK